MFIVLEEFNPKNTQRPIPRLVNPNNIEWVGYSKKIGRTSVRMVSGHEFGLNTDSITLWRLLQRAGFGAVNNAKMQNFDDEENNGLSAVFDFDEE